MTLLSTRPHASYLLFLHYPITFQNSYLWVHVSFGKHLDMSHDINSSQEWVSISKRPEPVICSCWEFQFMGVGKWQKTWERSLKTQQIKTPEGLTSWRECRVPWTRVRQLSYSLNESFRNQNLTESAESKNTYSFIEICQSSFYFFFIHVKLVN